MYFSLYNQVNNLCLYQKTKFGTRLMDKRGNWSITNARHGHCLDLYFHSIYIICYVYVGIKSQNLINKQYRVTWSMTNAYFGHFFDIMRDCFVSLAMKITHGTEEASFIITNFPSKNTRFNFSFFCKIFQTK